MSNPHATKLEIRQAVEELFRSEGHERANDAAAREKEAGRQAFVGRKPAWKKAIVILAEGQTIEFFEGV